MDGGFYLSNKIASTDSGSVLVVFYSEDLAAIASKIVDNGGDIVQEIFEFPGGKRFHFTDVTGNEFEVWSDK